jgi:hypothetical protein
MSYEVNVEGSGFNRPLLAGQAKIFMPDAPHS